MTKEQRTKRAYSADYVGAILEEMRSDFKVFGEGLAAVRSEVGNIKSNVETLKDRFDKFDIRLSSVESDINRNSLGIAALSGEVRKMARDNKDNAKATIEYLSRIEDEIQAIKPEIEYLKTSLKKKADLKRLEKVEKSVAKLEKMILAM